MPRAAPGRRRSGWIAAAGVIALGAASPCPALASTTRPRLRIDIVSVHDGRVMVALRTTGGTDRDVRLVVRCRGRVIARRTLAAVGPRRHTVDIAVRRGERIDGPVTVRATGRRPVGQTTSNTSS